MTERDVGPGMPGAVLAGGGSRRFGSPKALAELNGRSLIATAVATLSTVANPVIVVTGDERVARAAAVEARSDLRPEMGPLGGLETALDWARGADLDGVLVIGCDTPLLSAEALRFVLGDGARSRVAEGADGVHPLCGFYRTELLDEVRRGLDSGRLSLQALVAESAVETVSLPDRLGPDRARTELTNVNTPEALRAVQEASGG